MSNYEHSDRLRNNIYASLFLNIKQRARDAGESWYNYEINEEFWNIYGT